MVFCVCGRIYYIILCSSFKQVIFGYVIYVNIRIYHSMLWKWLWGLWLVIYRSCNKLSLSLLLWLLIYECFVLPQVTSHSNETWTVSTLVFNPSPTDNGAMVKCVAANPSLPTKTIDDHLQLNVVCEYTWLFSLLWCIW